MAWPSPYARIYDFNASNWPNAYDMNDQEHDQHVAQVNAILAEAMAQELRITALDADLTAHIADASAHFVYGLKHGLQLEMGTNMLRQVRIQATALAMDDWDTVVTSIDVMPNISVSGANGLDPDDAAVAADTWYRVFVIRDETNGVTAGLFSTSASPDLTGLVGDYTAKRFVGWVLTDGSNDIHPWAHFPPEGLWRIYYADHTSKEVGFSSGASWKDADMSPQLPAGIPFRRLLLHIRGDTGGVGDAQMFIRPKGSAAEAAETTEVLFRQDYTGGARDEHEGQVQVFLDANGVFEYYNNTLSSGRDFHMMGWYDDV